MKKQTKNIGMNVKPPKKECEDKNCPFHGNVKPRGKIFIGTVLAKDTHKTATVEWTYSIMIPKYERSETRRTKIRVHNPSCIDAHVGDMVKIAETRPLSKTKNFVIIENIGKEKGFIQKMEAREESKFIEEEKQAEEEAEKKKPKEEMTKKEEEKPDEETNTQKETDTAQTQKESDASQKGAEE